MIPKSIYQTFYTKNLPNNIQNLINDMLLNNPGYDHFLYDDDEIDNFIKIEFDSETYDAFKMLNVGAAKADFWRYCILYKRGGIYLDIDSSIIGKIDELITPFDKAIISRETNVNIFVQWCLMFSANHKVLEICINKCKDNILNKKTNNILYLTGPRVFSESIIEYCKGVDYLWETNDQSINIKLKDSNLDMRIYSFDFSNFCQFKHEYEKELGSFNLSNNRPKHWSEENKIFK
jgi:mannosyltransferase OCH1-like enzyme